MQMNSPALPSPRSMPRPLPSFFFLFLYFFFLFKWNLLIWEIIHELHLMFFFSFSFSMVLLLLLLLLKYCSRSVRCSFVFFCVFLFFWGRFDSDRDGLNPLGINETILMSCLWNFWGVTKMKYK